MIRLLKWGFWICVALLFVPVPTHDEDMKTSVLAQEVLQISVAVVADVSGFCERNPTTCDTGSDTFSSLASRVRLGAEQIYHYAMWMGDKSYTIPEPGSTPEPQSVHLKKVKPVQISPSQNTLAPADLKPAWRGIPEEQVALGNG